MRVKVLGPIEVAPDNGRPVDLGRRKQRALLAMLVVEVNHVVSSERLIELLWADVPPARATSSIQTYVSNLRRLLETHRPPRSEAEVLVTHPPGYMLRLAPADIDAWAFQSLAHDGERLLSEGNPERARDALAEALGLWRGPAFGEFATESFVRAEAARLEELRLVAVEARLEAEVALGNHAAAAAELVAAVVTHPLRERLYGLLMVALYRSGRQAEALRAYQRANQALGELGLEPGPALRALEADVLAHAPSLGAQPPGRRAASVRPSSPPAGASLVGRGAELSILQAALDSACDGHARVVLISGEPGIGKTRLAEELAHRAEATGALVGWGRCFDDMGAPPFWPWAQVIRTVVDGQTSQQLADLLGDGADDIAQVVPELKPSHPRSGAATGTRPAETARFRLFEAITGFLVRASGRRPLLVIIDDLHWADVASLELLRYLGTNLSKAPVVVVATYRTTDASSPQVLTRTLADLLRRPALDSIALSGLTSDAVGQMLVEGLGAALERAVVEAVHGRADGNPYFVVEIMRLLERRSTPPRLPNVLQGEVPDPVRDLVRSRLARLPDGVKALLHLAAVVGRDVELDLLAAAGGLSDGDALGFVEAALESGFLKDGAEAVGRYRFSHALVQEALYSELHGLRRARMHLQVAEALERLHGPDGDRVIAIAHHFNEALALDGPDRAFAYAVRAAEVAWSALAYEDAISHLSRALELLGRTPPGPDRAERELNVQLRLAGWTSMVKGWTAAAMGDVWQRATDLCRDTGQTPQLLASLWGLFVWSVMSGEIRTTRHVVDQMTDLGQASEDATALMLGQFAIGYLKLHLGQIPSAVEPLHRAVTLSQDLDDRSLIENLTVHPAVVSLSGLTVAWSLVGDREQAERWRKETLVAIERVDHPFSHVVGLVLIGAADSLWRDVDRVLTGAEVAVALATELGYHHYELQARVLYGFAMAQRGDPEAGMAVMDRALTAIENDGTQSLRPFLLALLGDVRRQCRRLDDGLSAVDAGIRVAELTHERFSLAELYRLRGELVLERGPDHCDEGATWLRRAVELAESQGAGLLARRAAASLGG